MISQYKFLNNVRHKPLALLAQLAMLRRRIALIITLYKIVELLFAAYRDYQQFSSFGTTKKSKL